MTTDLAALPWTADSPPTHNGAKGRKPHGRHTWDRLVIAAGVTLDGIRGPVDEYRCACGAVRDPAASRRSRNNGKRGRHAELVVARLIPGGRKVGQLGLPWDVEVGEYARLQVKQLAAKPGPAEIRRLIEAIPYTGDRLRGFVWVEAATHGPAGQAKVVWFDAHEFYVWHGDPLLALADGKSVPESIRFVLGHALVHMDLAEWIAEYVR